MSETNYDAPLAQGNMNLIEEILRTNSCATPKQLSKALGLAVGTISGYTKIMRQAGRIRYRKRPTPRTEGLWEIGKEPEERDGKQPVRPVFTSWAPYHERGQLECLWFGVPAQMADR